MAEPLAEKALATSTPNPEYFYESDPMPVLNPKQKLDMGALRYPEENLFLAIIILLNILIFAILGLIIVDTPSLIMWISIAGLVFFVSGKISYAFFYWFIYGNSVLITPSQYPEISKAVQRACEFIDLKPVPQIFVVHGAGMLELFLIKRFTKRGVLIFTSEIVDTLLQSGDSRQLMMIIGRQLGHIKAGHYKGWFFKDVIGGFAGPFHRAWWRKCNFTADRVGFLIAGDLDASRRALLSITVGKTLSAATNLDAIREQDNELRSHFFAWFRQLYLDYPYMIHRIMELESFQEFVKECPIDTSAKKTIGLLPDDVSKFPINEIGHLRQLVEAHNRRIRNLELKAAKFGLACPPEIMIEMEDIRKEISRLEQEIHKSDLDSFQ